MSGTDEGTASSEEGTTRALAYLRVSTLKQADNAGIEQQRERVDAYCIEQGYRLREDDVYTDVVSGAETDRDDYYRLLQDIESDKQGAEVLVAYDVPRFGRNAQDTGWLVAKATEFDLRLETCEGGRWEPDDAHDRLVFRIMSAVAEFEREAILQRMQRGKNKAHERGYWPSGQTPIGYKTEGPSGQRILVPDETAPYVREAFRRYAEGESMNSISHWLAEQQLHRDPRDPDSRVLQFPTQTVSRMLENVVYRGQLEYKDKIVEGQHDPLVDEGTWQTVQERRHG
jgi:site-specific DNA recombinase